MREMEGKVGRWGGRDGWVGIEGVVGVIREGEWVGEGGGMRV